MSSTHPDFVGIDVASLSDAAALDHLKSSAAEPTRLLNGEILELDSQRGLCRYRFEIVPAFCHSQGRICQGGTQPLKGLDDEDESMARSLTPDVIDDILGLVPESWLSESNGAASPGELRAAYRRYLLDRLAPPRAFVEEARHALYRVVEYLKKCVGVQYAAAFSPVQADDSRFDRHKPGLQGLEQPFHSPLGLRRNGEYRLYPQRLKSGAYLSGILPAGQLFLNTPEVVISLQ